MPAKLRSPAIIYRFLYLFFTAAFFFFVYQTPAELWDSVGTYCCILWRWYAYGNLSPTTQCVLSFRTRYIFNVLKNACYIAVKYEYSDAAFAWVCLCVHVFLVCECLCVFAHTCVIVCEYYIVFVCVFARAYVLFFSASLPQSLSFFSPSRYSPLSHHLSRSPHIEVTP